MRVETSATLDALMDQAEVQKRAQQQRLEAFLAEVNGPTGTSQYGQYINLWAELTNEGKTRKLEPYEERVLESAKTVVIEAFGDSGLIPALKAWYDTTALEKRAASGVAQQIPPATE